MVGFGALPSLIQLATLIILPESRELLCEASVH